MTEFPEHKSEKDIEQIVQQFVDAQLRGENPDIDEFVKQYPGLENGIRQRIHNLREIDGLFASLMQPEESDFQDTPAEHDLVGQKLGDFEIFCENENVVQAVKHEEKEIYGILFHPEVRQKDLIKNFCLL